MSRGRARIYNLITLIVIILAILWIVYVVSRLAGPPPAPTTEAVIVPTALVLPTETDTFTPTFTHTFTRTYTPTQTPTETLTPSITPSFIPSNTPITPTNTLTLTPVPTSTIEPSVTLTETPVPSLTITRTIEPTLTDTPGPTAVSFTPQATVPPPSAFPFEVRDDQVIFTTNFANIAGCAWQGIGGQVFSIDGSPLPGIRVHVFGNGLELFADSGSNTLYGPSGWEIAVSNVVNTGTYLVELQTPQGTIISPQKSVTFSANCGSNLALVNFRQNRPF
ncbi:MAG: hypothetical protein IAE89_08995 [Anaerolineae bacterium]|nr:hypothetical protein [Anaerolineae bacterium]